MTDKKQTHRRKLFTEHYPEQPPIIEQPERRLQTPQLQPHDIRRVVIERSKEGHSLRRISSELGLTLIQVLKHLGDSS